MMLSKVVLPLPFGPSMPNTDPDGTSKETPFNALILLYDLAILFSVRMALTEIYFSEK
jgi:hypothetical protein